MARLGGWTFGFVVANQVALFVVLALAGSVRAGLGLGLDLRLHVHADALRRRRGLGHERGGPGPGTRLVHARPPRLQAPAAQRAARGARHHRARGGRAWSCWRGRRWRSCSGTAPPGSTSTAGTGPALALLAVGLPGFCTFLFVVRVLQSMQRTRIAFWLYVIENGINIVLAIVLVHSLGVRGLAISLSVAYSVAAVLGLLVLRSWLGRLGAKGSWQPLRGVGRRHGRHGRGRPGRLQPLGLLQRHRPVVPGGGLGGGRASSSSPPRRRPWPAGGGGPTTPVGRPDSRGRMLDHTGARGHMAGVRIVTDSACDLTDELARASGITVVPLTIRFGDEELVDRRDLTPAEFWARCRTSSDAPRDVRARPRRLPGRLRAGGGRRRERRLVPHDVGRPVRHLPVGRHRGRGDERHRDRRPRHALGHHGPGPADADGRRGGGRRRPAGRGPRRHRGRHPPHPRLRRPGHARPPRTAAGASARPARCSARCSPSSRSSRSATAWSTRSPSSGRAAASLEYLAAKARGDAPLDRLAVASGEADDVGTAPRAAGQRRGGPPGRGGAARPRGRHPRRARDDRRLLPAEERVAPTQTGAPPKSGRATPDD